VVDQDHCVGVLFDLAGVAQVAGLWLLAGAARRVSVELRQHQHRNAQFLGQVLQGNGYLGYSVGTALVLAFGAHQAQVVDHQDVEALFALKPPGI